MISSKTSNTFILILFTLFPLGQVARSQPFLKDAFRDYYYVGTALNGFRIMRMDSVTSRIVYSNFNSVTAENDMKWERIHPRPGEYNFRLADRLVELAGEHDMYLVGHCLVWHSQTPRWVFQDEDGNPVSRDTLLARMKDHIFTIVGRYKGKVDCWDVVNEAIEGDGSVRNSPWSRIIGEDFIEKAFEYAHEADPEATLIYNDYGMTDRGRREGVLRMVERLKSKGIRIDGVGMQAHWSLYHPELSDVEESIAAYGAAGLQVMITELDVSALPLPQGRRSANISDREEYMARLNPYPDGLPEEMQQKHAERYADFFRIFNSHAGVVTRVTFWGVDDRASWKNNFPVRGRTDYALLFDRDMKPKPCFFSVIKTATAD